MLSRCIKHWRCIVRQHSAWLYQGERLIHQAHWQPEEEDALRLKNLLEAIPAGLPWAGTIEFEADAPYVHYLLVPWQDEIITPEEQRQYAANLIAEQYTLNADELCASVLDSPYGESAFAAAINIDFLSTLKKLANNARLHFRGCSTPFTHLVRRSGRKLPEEALFASINHDLSSFAIRHENQWHSIFTLHFPETAPLKQAEIANSLAGLPPLRRYIAEANPHIDGSCNI